MSKSSDVRLARKMAAQMNTIADLLHEQTTDDDRYLWHPDPDDATRVLVIDEHSGRVVPWRPPPNLGWLITSVRESIFGAYN